MMRRINLQMTPRDGTQYLHLSSLLFYLAFVSTDFYCFVSLKEGIFLILFSLSTFPLLMFFLLHSLSFSCILIHFHSFPYIFFYFILRLNFFFILFSCAPFSSLLCHLHSLHSLIITDMCVLFSHLFF